METYVSVIPPEPRLMSFDLDKEELETYLKSPMSFTVTLTYWLVPERLLSV